MVTSPPTPRKPPSANPRTPSACSVQLLHALAPPPPPLAPPSSSNSVLSRHACTAPSSPPVTITPPHALNFTHDTALKCAFHRASNRPVFASHAAHAPLALPAHAYAPSPDVAIALGRSESTDEFSNDSFVKSCASSARLSTLSVNNFVSPSAATPPAAPRDERVYDLTCAPVRTSYATSAASGAWDCKMMTSSSAVDADVDEVGGMVA
mmetsp:Transcript_2439/g.8030  ORF Transcript_2439/g.8030 Transcript_2439/m.8030 type:complete len:209 (-) Transcript_2439:8-634(-)